MAQSSFVASAGATRFPARGPVLPGSSRGGDPRPNPADGRSTVISLADRGAKHLEVTWQQFRSDIGSVFGDLPVEQQKQLLEIAPVLTDALRERLLTRPSVELPGAADCWDWSVRAARTASASAVPEELQAGSRESAELDR